MSTNSFPIRRVNNLICYSSVALSSFCFTANNDLLLNRANAACQDSVISHTDEVGNFNTGTLSFPTSPTNNFLEPTNPLLQAALAATVRLKIEDPEGSSFGTGTVIYSNAGKTIILTCGHIFRGFDNSWTITADIGWGSNTIKTLPAQLIDYDANARDVALVMIETEAQLPVMQLAPRNHVIKSQDFAFAIGCDHGQAPTTFCTTVIKLSPYKSVFKIDAVGRPAQGRSGGGLFSADGQLIGVCNAAVEEFDEGVYTTSQNVWQFLDKTRISNLLEIPEKACNPKLINNR